jgi:transposase
VFDAADAHQVGTDNGACLRTVSAGKTEWECFWTTVLAEGQLTVEGPFYDDGTDTTLAITGGTGVYTGATGTMLVHARGNPVGFHLTGGEAHDLVGADHLLPDMQAETLIADKAFDADKRVIEPLTTAGKTIVIPPKSGRRSPRTYDRDLYKARHLIENFFARFKQFRAIATRYDKTARNFLAAIYLAASVVWLN